MPLFAWRGHRPECRRPCLRSMRPHDGRQPLADSVAGRFAPGCMRPPDLPHRSPTHCDACNLHVRPEFHPATRCASASLRIRSVSGCPETIPKVCPIRVLVLLGSVRPCSLLPVRILSCKTQKKKRYGTWHPRCRGACPRYKSKVHVQGRSPMDMDTIGCMCGAAEPSMVPGRSDEASRNGSKNKGHHRPRAQPATLQVNHDTPIHEACA